MTKFSLISLFVLSALLSSALSVPFNLLNEDSNAIGIRETNCAKTCTDTDHLIKFQVGTTYSYNVDLTTELTEQSLNTKENNNEDEQQVKIGAVADISVYGPCELVLKLRKVHLTGIVNHRQMAEQLEAEPLHFGYDNGRIVDVCASTDDKPWTINVKKSILSALQMSANDVSQKDTIIETDISGQCETVYEPIETNQKQTDFVIRKVKQLNKFLNSKEEESKGDNQTKKVTKRIRRFNEESSSVKTDDGNDKIVRLDSIWIEQILIRKEIQILDRETTSESIVDADRMTSNSTTIESIFNYGSEDTNPESADGAKLCVRLFKQNNRRRCDENLFRLSSRLQGPDYSSMDKADRVQLIKVGIHGRAERTVRIQFGQRKLSIGDNLQWSLWNGSLNGNESVTIVGKTIQVELNSNQAVNVDQKDLTLKLVWTPTRQLISVDLRIGLPGRSMTNHTTKSIDIWIESCQKPALLSEPLKFENATLEMFGEIEDEPPKTTASVNLNDSEPKELDQTLRNTSCWQWIRSNDIGYGYPDELEACLRVENGCNLAAYYVHRQKLTRVPNQCLHCGSGTGTDRAKFGSRRIIFGSDRAEIVFLLDGSCHRTARRRKEGKERSRPVQTVRLMRQLIRLSKMIEREFRTRRIRTKFMIITPDQDGKYHPAWPNFERKLNFTFLMNARRPQTDCPKPLTNLNITTKCTKTVANFSEALWPGGGRNSFDFLQNFPYPPAMTSRHFILIDCLDGKRKQVASIGGPNRRQTSSSCVENEIDFSTARNMFLHSNNFVHIVSGLGISGEPLTSPKMRHIIGIDWRQGFAGNLNRHSANSATSSPVLSPPVTSPSLNSALRLLRGHILPHRDICHVLALETNGTVFNHRILKMANSRILAVRLASNHHSGPCQRCDCILSKDFVSTEEECTLCQPRHHTLRNPYRKQSSASSSVTTNSTETLANSSMSTDPRTVDSGQDDWHLDTKQIWTEEDEQNFREVYGDLPEVDDD